MSYIDSIKNIWNIVKDSFNESLPQGVADLWFDNIEIVSFDNNCITMTTDFKTAYNVINQKYLDTIKEKFSEMLGFDIDVELLFVESKKAPAIDYTPMIENAQGVKHSQPDKLPTVVIPQNYSFEYTFENFIVGDSNKFAHAACVAIADRPATSYNPLFIYGPSGIGKTHLMCAVVNEMKKKKPFMSVIYISCEDFTNELIESIKNQQMDKFREKYRNCDILLIDDVQFISGKVSTQEEFFHTFNALHDNHKQIILSSDRPPKDIGHLADRLKSRFEWGIIADIQAPDLELRMAIIKKKAEQVDIEIPNDVVTLLAENLRSNIRQIEGAIKKLSALAFLSGKKISVELAKSCLTEILVGVEPINVTIDKIHTAVFKKYGIKKEDIIGQKRNKDIANARHISIYLVREITEMSLDNIGKIFGDRDHSTVKSSYDKVKKMITDPVFDLEIKELIHEITGQ